MADILDWQQMTGSSARKVGTAIPIDVAIIDSSGAQVSTFGGSAAKSGTSAVTSPADSATSVTVLAANVDRLGFVLYNDSSAIAYVKLGTTASTTSFTKKLLPQEVWSTRDLGCNHTGRIDAIWASAPGGAMRVTELT